MMFKRYTFIVMKRRDEWIALSPSVFNNGLEGDFLREQGFSFFDADLFLSTCQIWADHPMEAIEEAKEIYNGEINRLKMEINRIKRGDLVFSLGTARCLLGLDEDFTRDVLETSRKKLLRKYHPDHNGGEGDSIVKFINEAYQYLKEFLETKK